MPQTELFAELPLNPHDKLCRVKAIAAGLEEVSRGTHAWQAKQLLPEFGEALLGRSGWFDPILLRLCRRSSKLKRLPVDLAAGSHRHGRQDCERSLHHVVRQSPEQVQTEIFRGRKWHAGSRKPGGEHLMTIFALRNDRTLADPVVLREHRFDFFRLDAETANFHLSVHAPQEYKVAVRERPDVVAGAKQTVRRIGAEGVPLKFSGGQIRRIYIAAPNARPPDIELARNANRNRICVLVQNIDAHVGDRLTDRDQRFAFPG